MPLIFTWTINVQLRTTSWQMDSNNGGTCGPALNPISIPRHLCIVCIRRYAFWYGPTLYQQLTWQTQNLVKQLIWMFLHFRWFCRSVCQTVVVDEWKENQEEEINNQEMYAESVLERVIHIRSRIWTNPGIYVIFNYTGIYTMFNLRTDWNTLVTLHAWHNRKNVVWTLLKYHRISNISR